MSTVPSPTAAPAATPLKKTALNATHRALKAKMVDFGGWDMPVEYPASGGGLCVGLIGEHMAVRTGVGLFDVSHMGEIQFRGPGSLAAVQHITMNDASKLNDGQAHYSALLTPQGTFVDDILVHRLGANDYLLVVNAGTTDKDFAWIRSRSAACPEFTSATTRPTTRNSRCRARARSRPSQKLTKIDLAAIKNYWFTWGTVAGIPNVDDRAHRLLRRRRLRSLHSLRRANHRQSVERAARCRRRVRHPSLRPRRAQHPAPRSRHEPLRPRNL